MNALDAKVTLTPTHPRWNPLSYSVSHSFIHLYIQGVCPPHFIIISTHQNPKNHFTLLHLYHHISMAAEIQQTHHHSATLSRTESNLQKSKVYNIDVVVEPKTSSSSSPPPPPPSSDDEKDYTQRAQWLRAAVLGANDGLLSTASLMMGVGAVRKDVKTMLLTGIAGLIAGACSMAIGEFVSVYSQYDIELSQMKRQGNTTQSQKDKLPNPYYAAFASAIAFAVGAGVPLLGAAFVNDYKVRLGVVVAVVSLALIVFGGLSAVLGKAPLVKSALRVLIGGWFAMAVTFGFTKLVNHAVI